MVRRPLATLGQRKSLGDFMRACFRGLAAGLLLTVATSSAYAQTQAPACGDLRKLTALDMKNLADGRITLGVTIVDRPSQLMFDTTGDFRGLTPETATALGAKPVKGGDLVKDIPGHETAENVLLPSVTLGGVKIPEAAFLVLSRKEMRLPDGANVDGRFTLDTLLSLGLDFDLDFAANQMGLFLQDHCEGKVVYWPSTALSILPFAFDTAFRINIPVKLDGQVVTAVLDTSVTDNTLDLDVAKDIGLTLALDGMKKVGTDSSTGKDVYEQPFKMLSFDDVGFSNPQIKLLRSKSRKPGLPPLTGAPLVIGINSIKKLHIFFAVREQRLYITPGGVAAAAAPAPATAPAKQ